MAMINTGSISLYVEERGEGQPLLFISGTGGDLRAKPNVLDSPLAKHFRVIAYDQRGLGQSDKPDEPYTMQDYGDDAAALLDAMNLERAHVVGVSFGGMVAQHLALDHPDRVSKLVLCCTSPGGVMPSYPFHELPDDIDPVDRMLRLMHVSDTRRDEAWQQENPGAVEKMIAYTRASAIEDHTTPAFRAGARRQLEARADHDTLDRLKDIKAETLICAGRYDGIAPPLNQEKMHECIPGSRLQWYEGGHLFTIQDKSAWPDVIEFLASN